MTPKQQQPIRMMERRLSSDSACNLATLNRYYPCFKSKTKEKQEDDDDEQQQRSTSPSRDEEDRMLDFRGRVVSPSVLSVLSSSFDGNTSDDTHVSVAIDVNKSSPPKINHIMLRKKWGISPAKARAERATRHGIIRTAMVLFFVTVWIFAMLNVISLATIGEQISEQGSAVRHFVLDLW